MSAADAVQRQLDAEEAERKRRAEEADERMRAERIVQERQAEAARQTKVAERSARLRERWGPAEPIRERVREIERLLQKPEPKPPSIGAFILLLLALWLLSGFIWWPVAAAAGWSVKTDQIVSAVTAVVALGAWYLLRNLRIQRREALNRERQELLERF